MFMDTRLHKCAESTVVSQTQWIPCNGCGADAFEDLSVTAGWHIGRCRRCSLIYLNPMPIFAPSDEFSELSLSFQYTRFQRNLTAELLEHDRMQMGRQLEIACLRSGIHGPGRFLDFGCGSGSSVRAAADLGWAAVGIDMDPALVDLGRKELQVDLICGTLPDLNLEGNQFHFCRLRDVIEHLPNPYDVLLDVARLLVPGGIVLIATPNEGALPSQIKRRLGFGRNTIATVAPPHHVHGFVPETLARIITRAGLRISALGTTTPVDPLYVTARNMSSSKILRNLFWRAASTYGKGSMLIAWAQKPSAS